MSKFLTRGTRLFVPPQDIGTRILFNKKWMPARLRTVASPRDWRDNPRNKREPSGVSLRLAPAETPTKVLFISRYPASISAEKPQCAVGQASLMWTKGTVPNYPLITPGILPRLWRSYRICCRDGPLLPGPLHWSGGLPFSSPSPLACLGFQAWGRVLSGFR